MGVAPRAWYAQRSFARGGAGIPEKRRQPRMLARLQKHSPLGQIFAAGLRNDKSTREIMKESIEEAGRAVAHDLERYLTTWAPLPP